VLTEDGVHCKNLPAHQLSPFFKEDRKWWKVVQVVGEFFSVVCRQLLD
jgi:hypothetical protein